MGIKGYDYLSQAMMHQTCWDILLPVPQLAERFMSVQQPQYNAFLCVTLLDYAVLDH